MRKKIFMVHFRNIVGGYLNFNESLPGQRRRRTCSRRCKAYRSVGYDGMLCPDHVPQSDADPDNQRQHSFCLGYTRALIQAVDSLS